MSNITLQEKVKMFFIFTVNECKKIVFQAILEHFYWFVYYKTFTECKGQLPSSNVVDM